MEIGGRSESLAGKLLLFFSLLFLLEFLSIAPYVYIHYSIFGQSVRFFFNGIQKGVTFQQYFLSFSIFIPSHSLIILYQFYSFQKLIFLLNHLCFLSTYLLLTSTTISNPSEFILNPDRIKICYRQPNKLRHSQIDRYILYFHCTLKPAVHKCFINILRETCRRSLSKYLKNC